jgi:hypothetical protein
MPAFVSAVTIAGARVPRQVDVDVGFGDVVKPASV